MSADCDLVVIGAGPAGMAASVTAVELGLSVVLLDEQRAPGGQIYRDVEAPGLARPAVLGPDYDRGKALAAALRSTKLEYLPDTSVWQLSRDLEIGLHRDGRARFIKARKVIVAAGAMERPMPIPGWTLPGVMTAGAGQVLLKSAGIIPTGPVVLAGSGPLLLLLAWQYLRAGLKVDALLDTTPLGNYFSAAPMLPKALTAPGYIIKGLKLLVELRMSGIRMLSGISRLTAMGHERLGSIEFVRGSRTEVIPTKLLMLHQGVVPNTHIAVAAGCEQDWDTTQLCWKTRCDEWGATSVQGLFVAGDGAGIMGALASEHTGRLAALGVAYTLGKLGGAELQRRAAPEHSARLEQLRARPFLDTLYRPAEDFRLPADDTLLCRCEEVTAGEVRLAVGLGCAGPNQAKSYTRCGMGPCQGRVCGGMVSELIARERRMPVGEAGFYRVRPPLKPITLEQLANAATD